MLLFYMYYNGSHHHDKMRRLILSNITGNSVFFNLFFYKLEKRRRTYTETYQALEAGKQTKQEQYKRSGGKRTAIQTEKKNEIKSAIPIWNGRRNS